MTMYEKLQLAQQGRNTSIKEEDLNRDHESPAVPVTQAPLTDAPTKTTSSGSSRKAGRSFKR